MFNIPLLATESRVTVRSGAASVSDLDVIVDGGVSGQGRRGRVTCGQGGGRGGEVERGQQGVVMIRGGVSQRRMNDSRGVSGRVPGGRGQSGQGSQRRRRERLEVGSGRGSSIAVAQIPPAERKSTSSGVGAAGSGGLVVLLIPQLQQSNFILVGQGAILPEGRGQANPAGEVVVEAVLYVGSADGLSQSRGIIFDVHGL